MHSIKEDENEEESEEDEQLEIKKEAPASRSLPAEKVEDLNFMDKLKEQIECLDINSGGVEFDQQVENDLKSMIKDYDKDINRENNRNVEELLRKKSPPSSKKQVKWSDSNESLEIVASGQSGEDFEDYDEEDEDDDDDYTDSDDYDKVDGEEIMKPKVTSVASASAATAPQSMVIKIKHTKNETLDELDRRNRLSRDKPALENPGDIYTTFHQPKSILKNKDDVILVDDAKEVSDRHVSAELKEPKNVLNEKFEPTKV